MTTTNLLFTVHDLSRLPDDGSRYEVIDGELYVSTAPHAEHQAALDQTSAALVTWSNDTGRGWTLSGVGVIFSLHNGVVPDLCWISDERLPYAMINPATGKEDGKLHAAPDLAVEILSPGRENEERDRQTKLTLYSRQGVLEYWIVNRFLRTVEVYRRRDAALMLDVTLTAQDTLSSPLLPGFALPVARIFRLPKALARESRDL
jgi:Uma2 family endonuclease